MAQLTASRTLVKSSPELWAECSDAASLARHLGAFGEIQITKLEPETAVAWEGEDVRGTVTLEPSGWGTRVVLTATVDGESVCASPSAADPAPEAPTPAVGLEEPAAAEVPEPALDLEPEPKSDPGPDPGSESEVEPTAETTRAGFFRRLFGGWRRSPVPVPDPDPTPGPAPPPPVEAVAPEPTPVEAGAPEPAPVEPAASASPTPVEPDPPRAGPLVSALDSLGMAHRRPFTHG